MFFRCLEHLKPAPSPKVANAINTAIAEAIFSYVSMVSVTTIVHGSKTVSEKYVDFVENELAKKVLKKENRAASQKGGKGIPFTGLGAQAYNGTGQGVQAATVDFSSGVARPEHATSAPAAWVGGAASTACGSISKAIKQEICMILKDQSMRKKKGVIDVIAKKIEGRVSQFLHPLVNHKEAEGVLRLSDVKRSAKTAFRGLRILFE